MMQGLTDSGLSSVHTGMIAAGDTAGNIYTKCICCNLTTSVRCIRGACSDCHQRGLCHDDI
jgi:hypothetical protein